MDCINDPDHIAEDKEIKCYKKIWIDKYLLMTYTKDDNDDIIVITVIKTSKIIKYL